MSEGSLGGLKGLLFMMLFYSVSVTLIANFFPAFTDDYTGDYITQGVNVDTNDIVSRVDLGVQAQTELPLVELGALLFYSGNLVLDLAVNFITALPQMTVLAINIILSVVSPDAVFSQQIKLILQTVLFVAYMLGLLQLILNLRSGTGVPVN